MIHATSVSVDESIFIYINLLFPSILLQLQRNIPTNAGFALLWAGPDRTTLSHISRLEMVVCGFGNCRHVEKLPNISTLLYDSRFMEIEWMSYAEMQRFDVWKTICIHGERRRRRKKVCHGLVRLYVEWLFAC
ncbi:hypothetical protein TNCT_578341 [Trichonephila clavata]|uniref:Uncharacterized protein n=1 Tax=Trichonephila clavata TaxID=2740835 RepID=A0A8X6L4P0_TRICU|nr:hypothetical protein TNCT_578341 [Trichonephila clavata]